MHKIIAALLAAAPCTFPVQAQTPPAGTGALFTLEQAIASAGGSAPAADAAKADIQAAEAAGAVAGLRPNPSLQTDIENVAGTGPYGGYDSAETTVALSIPIELGGKRQARVAVAGARTDRARLAAAMTQADIRLQVTGLYIEALAADRRMLTARDQIRIATDAARAAQVRVEAGRASPIEMQRAEVARINAEANGERSQRLAEAARVNLARRIGQPVTGALDTALLDRLPAPAHGPARPAEVQGTLALAAAQADVAIADAQVRLARSQRVPDLTVAPGVRRLEATNDSAAVLSLSLPIPLFNGGRAAVAQAHAERTRADAQRRMTALDAEQAITDMQTEVENAATMARTASGPALAAAQEAARIARIGYREGKFGQLDLLDAERTLAETRLSAIDALAAYHNARARLERLTTPAPAEGE